MSTIVELNVGGMHFATTLQTLLKFPNSMLAKMCTQNSMGTLKDRNGRYFIDRDGTYFSIILNYMRTGEINIPHEVDLERVANEADFYGLEELATIIMKKKCESEKKEKKLENKPLFAEVLRNSTMDTWKVYAESKYKEFMPIIMDKLLIQTKTHPFFEAEISMVMATTWGDDVSRIQVMAQYKNVPSFLIVVPLKFVGQPVCEIWSEFLANEGFNVSYTKSSTKDGWTISISWFNQYKKPTPPSV